MEKECRICYTTLSKDNMMINPCLCKGTMRWVHHSCLKKFIQISGSYNCPQCNLNYSITNIYDGSSDKKWEFLLFLTFATFSAYGLIALIYPEYGMQEKVLLTIFLLLSGAILTNFEDNYDYIFSEINRKIQLITDFINLPDRFIINNINEM